MTNKEIASTILAQLGGNRFAAMTGAKTFTAIENGLAFALPGGGGFCRDGINRVGISLMPSDTYTVSFSRVRGRQIKLISTHTEVYCDGLREVFETATGLRTSL